MTTRIVDMGIQSMEELQQALTEANLQVYWSQVSPPPAPPKPTDEEDLLPFEESLMDFREDELPVQEIRVVVTEDHIRRGRPLKSNACAVYYAMTDMGYKVMVDGAGVDIFDGDIVCFMFPRRVCQWIEAFDRGEPVHPIAFTIYAV